VTDALLTRARAGDGDAFRRLVEPHEAELRVHCYRMLGSVFDADDAVQETLLAAWRALHGFEERASFRSWLYRIATNRCLNAIRAGARRPPSPPVPPFTPPAPTRHGEVTWLQPFPDVLLDQVPDAAPGPEARYQQREAVKLAFVAGLQRLPARQAATLVLRDVLGYPAAEVAQLLDTTETAVKGMLQRARATLENARSGTAAAHTAAAHTAPAGTARAARTSARRDERHLTRRFADAFEGGDVEALVSMLTDDAWLAMPPAPHEYLGPAAVTSFLRASFGWRGRRALRLVPTRANTQPAFGCYLADLADPPDLDGLDGPVGRPAGVLVLTLDDDRVRGITRFHDVRLHRRFGLSETIRV
jgi:RNA polymerase sigma-70 factor (TIGR02960 family)